jgi:phosphatidylserine/phosphatidylglycerophosphate/cardiolipin synthase-like enzyme
MSERLQENVGRFREAEPVVLTTKLILDQDYIKRLTELVKNAKSEINICAYAWRWYENQPETGIQQFNSAIVHAKARGVNVRVICDGYKVCQLLRKQGIKSSYLQTNKTLHTKAISIDNTALLVGSHNLTKSATQDNFEMSVQLRDLESILQFKNYFNKMWGFLNVA